eukprot:4777780-Prymnesium_polylepis.1
MMRPPENPSCAICCRGVGRVVETVLGTCAFCGTSVWGFITVDVPSAPEIVGECSVACIRATWLA